MKKKRISQKDCREFILNNKLPLTIRRTGQYYFLTGVERLPRREIYGRIISWNILYNKLKEMIMK